jgi:hypothetical protein
MRNFHCSASRIAPVNSGTLCGTLRGDNPSCGFISKAPHSSKPGNLRP